MPEVYIVSERVGRPIRVHHFLTGAALAIIGAALMLHDRADFREAVRLR